MHLFTFLHENTQTNLRSLTPDQDLKLQNTMITRIVFCYIFDPEKAFMFI